MTPCIEHRRPTLRQSLLSRSRLVGINSNPGWIRRKIQCRWLWINRQFRTVRDVELNSEFPHTKYQPCAMEDPGENKVCIEWDLFSLNPLTEQDSLYISHMCTCFLLLVFRGTSNVYLHISGFLLHSSLYLFLPSVSLFPFVLSVELACLKFIVFFAFL